MNTIQDFTNKYSISERDLYILSKLEADKSSSKFINKDVIKAKQASLLTKYKISILERGKFFKLLKNNPIHNDETLKEKYKNEENNSELNEVGKKAKRNLIIMFISIMFVIFAISIKENNTSSNNSNTQDSSKKVTFSEAQTFMQSRFANIGQTLMKSKTVSFNGTQLYMFMSVAEDGTVCISSVSENALEVFATDCGTVERKISEWNAVQ